LLAKNFGDPLRKIWRSAAIFSSGTVAFKQQVLRKNHTSPRIEV
jgi:hypothetical protein